MHAQNVHTVEIANWYDNNPSATVLIYDDWSPGQRHIAFGEHIKRQIPGTFAVTTDNIVDSAATFSLMREGVRKGMEIANHSSTHPNLTVLSSDSLELEIESPRKDINAHVTNQRVSTYVYPLGAYNQTVVDHVKKHHIGARKVGEPLYGWKYDFANSIDDYYAIPTKRVWTGLGVMAFESTINMGIRQGGLLTFMIHSIYSPTVEDTWWDTTSEAKYLNMLNVLEKYRSKTWICTFSDAIKYHKIKKYSTLSTSNELQTKNMFHIDIQTHTISLSDHDRPITINYVMQEGDVFEKVVQGGKELPFTISNGRLTTHVLPSKGRISLFRKPK